MVISYAIVLLSSLSVVTVFAYLLVEDHRDELARERLEQDARQVFAQIRPLFQSESSLNEIARAFDEQARLNDVYLFLGNATGGVVRQASPQDSQEANELTPEALPFDLTGTIEGRLSMREGGTHLYFAVSIARFFQSRNPLNIETLVVSVPRDGVFSIVSDVAPAVLWAGLIGLGVSVLSAFYLARSVHKPIQRLSEATEAIARGDYDHKIPELGSKELRGLGAGLNRMAAQAKSSNQRLRFFVADVSHQLRNPLTSIRGFAQAILDGTAKDTETVQRAAQTIEEESMRMMRQVEQLLELARMQSGQVDMARTPFDVNELLEHCHEIFAIHEKENRIQVRIEIDPLPPVIGDIDRMEQVFVNLIDN
ncbi:MAG: HAMP domain-containing sensor histidine kinase, partial [Chloroflexi bacterium]|nr:HAMP domain-containing sensor histidine kinase [Chloroflexota bacterium]